MNNDSQTTDRLRRKRIVFRLIVLLMAYGAVEAIAIVAYRPITGKSFFRREDARENLIKQPDVRIGREQAGLGMRDANMSIHPYFGYVYTPRDSEAEPNAIAISEDGFLDDKPVVRKRDESRLLVGIMGGSVAGQLGTWHSGALKSAVMNRPEFDREDVEFIRLGMPGYHQPQQLQQLTYVLVKGGEFDVVVNIDGFNEIAVPAALNAPRGANPLYPMNWSMIALDVPDLKLRRHLGAIAYLQEERRMRAERFHDSLRAYSVLARLLREFDDNRLARSISQHAWQVQQFPIDDTPYFIRGPEHDHNPPGGLVPYCVDVWKRSSQQMHTVCESHGIRYLHFLQPNQYLPESKPLSNDEQRIAYEAQSPYRQVVEEGYPLLQAAGKELRSAGVEFVDLSLLFREVDDTLYVDNCCHFNRTGNEIMSEAIAEVLTMESPKVSDSG